MSRALKVFSFFLGMVQRNKLRGVPHLKLGLYRQIFKVRTVRKPDVFFPDAGLLTLLEIEEKKNEK